MTTIEIEQKIQDIHIALSANPDPNTRQKLELGLEIFQSLLLAEQQKKSESQPIEKSEQLPTKPELQEWQKKAEKEIQQTREEIANMQGDEKAEHLGKKLITQYANMVERESIKTVKAPTFVAPDELINVILEDAKGNEYTRIGTKAQVRALTRKYFSNVHESWMGKERKMKTGFKNLLSYVVAWKEFDRALPVLRDVLPDYDRYNKGGESKEASEAFKVAQELYGKIVEILNDVK